MTNLDEEGREYLQRKSLESEYVDFGELCDANGFTLLNIDKIGIVISYLAKRINKLYKVKLMKMLWYCDVQFLKLHGRSMTGLVYCHQDMGALPIGHYKITGLEKVKMEEEFEAESSKYRFYPNESLDKGTLSGEEKQVPDAVIEKFRA